MRSLHATVKSSNQRVKRLQTRSNELITNQVIHLESQDADDISTVMGKATPIVQATFPDDSPQSIIILGATTEVQST